MTERFRSRPGARTLPAWFATDHLGDDIQELIDGFQFIERIDSALEIERHILVNQNVAEPGKALERPHEIGREPLIASQIADRFRVIFEAFTTPSRQLARDVDHELAHRQEREQNVVVKRDVALE